MNEKYNMSFRCYFDNDEGPRFTTHYVPQFAVAEIPKWIECYLFTHPNVLSISCKVWMTDDSTFYTDEKNEKEIENDDA